jgi:hypothetical protein
MDRLFSCYFCGVAPDESLRDYPLAPGEGDPTAVVTLCPTCRRKLEAVLSTVTASDTGAAADSDTVTETAAEVRAADDAGGETQQPRASDVTDALGSAETSDETAVRPEASDTAGGRESGGEPAGDDSAANTVSTLEYNKVMRLLQNREFPVDRTEIVDLAANAYELTERECREIIDVAVDRGLVDQEAGKLVRPGD